MKQINKSSKALLIITIVSYLLIVFTLESWNMFLGVVILLSPLGLPYFPDILYFPFGFAGIILCGWLLISKKSVSGRQKIVRWGILCLYVPLIVYHCIEPFSIRRYDMPILIAPEIVFILVSVMVIVKTFQHSTKQPEVA